MTLLGPLHLIVAVLGLLCLTGSLIRLSRDRTDESRRLAMAAGLAMAVPFAVGCALYPSYRAEIKPGLSVDFPALATAFESKEHLAAMGLCCVLGGAGALLDPDGVRAGRSLLMTGWLLCSAVAIIGVTVTWWPSLTP